jgi:predicted ATPase
MIQNIHLQNFKNHKDTQISLGNLTLLCGQNGVGKSSMIQSLLVLRQTFEKGILNEKLSLNEPLCELGNGKDILFLFAENKNKKIGIELTIHSQYLKWIFDTQNRLTKDFLDLDGSNKLNPHIEKALEYIENLDYAGYFREMEKSIKTPDATFSLLKEEFINKTYNDSFASRLLLFAKSSKYYSKSTSKLDKTVLETFNIVTINTPIFSLFNHNFQYISAAREAKYKSNDYLVDSKKQLSIVEGRAELTAHFLYKYQNETVLETLLHPNYKDNTTLLYQVTAWEKEISKGVQIHPKKVGENYEIKYKFDGINKEVTREHEFSSKNVGFGISYSLPIIVAILYAKKGSLIIIENPEAHLHPYGQAKLAELLCIAAQAGIQIIIETHSDHILNGVLVQCKKFEVEEKGIDRNKVKIWYFERDEETHSAKAIEVEISDRGKINKAPIGFFDQFGKDLRYLMRNNNEKSNG